MNARLQTRTTSYLNLVPGRICSALQVKIFDALRHNQAFRAYA